MSTKLLKPNYIFETSWEVCNKVGGIHTVISTKALSLVKNYKDNLILIGPDVYRESDEHPEFEEDFNLYKDWKEQAISDGFNVRIGRWKIEGNPVVILLDFTPFFAKKDEIFAQLWEEYKLDSISGHWDYIEPTIFGYVAGMIIENFCSYNLTAAEKALAQFHEWMTGSGVLYLKSKAPEISTAFTTHATVIGRSIAGNGLPLYDKLSSYNGDLVAKNFGVTAKQSLEKLSGIHADVFTTVSEITAKECKQFFNKEVDIVTPNGFEDKFVPEKDEYIKIKDQARSKLHEVSSNLLSCELSKDTIYIATSGRYEYKNKGIDLYIDALSKLNNDTKLDKNIVAFVLVPANNYGARKDLLDKIKNKTDIEFHDRYLTHGLHYSEHDPTLNKLKEAGLFNRCSDKVKVIFVPSYLNGNDGIFDMPYYHLLMGLDLTVFASYYEPWGYTPLESLAFHIPTITTTLAGFGLWVNKETYEGNESILVVERTDSDEESSTNAIAQNILDFSLKSQDKIEEIKKQSLQTSKIALWKNLIKNYEQAYSIALNKAVLRSQGITKQHQEISIKKVAEKSQWKIPNWKEIEVHTNIPEKLKGLEEMIYNLWWSWNEDAINLFKSIDPVLWEESDYNPIKLLEDISSEALIKLVNDNDFINKYNNIYQEFKDYINTPKKENSPKIAYFSMEYGLHNSLKIYSGGLGILAGDYLKEASDSNIDMVGVGLLYRHGYFKQKITINGEQQAISEPQHFSRIPISPVRCKDGTFKKIAIVLPGRTVHARIWKVNVGRIPLYLLDTDLATNPKEDRYITSQLYGGDWENRLKQEILLGAGGIRALTTLDIKPNIYHCNEGHAAFIGIERLRHLRTKRQFTYEEAKEIIKSSTLFTTHTPVPAGHDYFDEGLIRKYLSHYTEHLQISWEKLMELGSNNTDDKRFSMSYLAANMSQEINGVSYLHGKVTQSMFKNLWDGYFEEETPIGYVTNGVHLPTWTSKEWLDLYKESFGEEFLSDQSNFSHWEKIYNVDNEKIWKIRSKSRGELIEYVKDNVQRNWMERFESPKTIFEITHNLDKEALTIGFARRFATYKRAHLLFTDLDRLSRIVNNPDKPVQFVFAGKAHPHDNAGQDLIKYIIDISKRKEFLGKIIFLDNYNIELAKKLVHGVDIWLNTPMRPLEASGTSGMKSIMNGGLHFSVLDGWWVEGYQDDAGWYLPMEDAYTSEELQNELDAETIYSLIENQITTSFYKRNSNNVPDIWVKYIKNSIANIVPKFTTKRMMDDYIERFYKKLYERTLELKKDDYKKALEVAGIKSKILESWHSIEVIEATIPDIDRRELKSGDTFSSKITIDSKEMPKDSIGVELIIAETSDDEKLEINSKYEYKLKGKNGSIMNYTLNFELSKPGDFSFGIRLYAKHKDIPCREDLNLVRWL